MVSPGGFWKPRELARLLTALELPTLTTECRVASLPGCPRLLGTAVLSPNLELPGCLLQAPSLRQRLPPCCRVPGIQLLTMCRCCAPPLQSWCRPAGLLPACQWRSPSRASEAGPGGPSSQPHLSPQSSTQDALPLMPELKGPCSGALSVESCLHWDQSTLFTTEATAQPGCANNQQPKRACSVLSTSACLCQLSVEYPVKRMQHSLLLRHCGPARMQLSSALRHAALAAGGAVLRSSRPLCTHQLPLVCAAARSSPAIQGRTLNILRSVAVWGLRLAAMALGTALFTAAALPAILNTRRGLHAAVQLVKRTTHVELSIGKVSQACDVSAAHQPRYSMRHRVMCRSQEAGAVHSWWQTWP